MMTDANRIQTALEDAVSELDDENFESLLVEIAGEYDLNPELLHRKFCEKYGSAPEAYRGDLRRREQRQAAVTRQRLERMLERARRLAQTWSVGRYHAASPDEVGLQFYLDDELFVFAGTTHVGGGASRGRPAMGIRVIDGLPVTIDIDTFNDFVVPQLQNAINENPDSSD